MVAAEEGTMEHDHKDQDWRILSNLIYMRVSKVLQSLPVTPLKTFISD